MGETLFVINPNSSAHVTAGIDRAVDPLRSLGVAIACKTLEQGPPGIETRAQADAVVAPLLDLGSILAPDAAALVIACFGDPGLPEMRAVARCPVFGIQESAVLTAMSRGHRFGVISILATSVERHRQAFDAMGVLGRCAGDRALDLGVGDLADAPRTLARMIEIGSALRDQDGADVLILGCAGMAQYRARLEAALELPVIEPCQAAAAMAVGRIALERGG